MNADDTKTVSRTAAILRDGHFWIPFGVLIGGLILLARIM